MIFQKISRVRALIVGVPRDVVAAVAILLFGVLLEAFLGDEHFQRSGSLLVALALISAALKNELFEEKKLDSEDKYLKRLVRLNKHFRASSRTDLLKLIYPIAGSLSIIAKGNLDASDRTGELKDKFDEINISIRGVEDLVGQNNLGEEHVDALETRSEEAINNDWEEYSSDKLKASRVATVDYYREMAIAVLGTIVWGYGDILSCIVRATTNNFIFLS